MRAERVSSPTQDIDPEETLVRLAPSSRQARLIRMVASTAAAIVESRSAAPRLLGVIVLSVCCAAAIVIGWVLVLVSLLYVVAAYSTTTWLLTALGIAAAHGVLAAACWRSAVAVARELTTSREH